MPITAENISLTYSAGTPFETAALRGVSFTIEDGEFLGIMGHTGCGKSTVLQMMDGLMKPTAGRILLDGRDINERTYDRSELRSKVGLVFQYPECQLFETTVEKDVAFGLKHSGLGRAETEERVRWALTALGFDFDAVRRQSPLGFSGGEKRRIAIAGILAVRPKFLLLDEPIAGLDPLGRDDFLRLLEQLNRDGMTIVMVSHNADSIGEHARRVLVLSDGKIVRDGATREVFSDVEAIRAQHLGVSRAREIAYLLAQRGVDIEQNITKLSELTPAVIAALRGGGAK